jgi:hypothetical protein
VPLHQPLGDVRFARLAAIFNGHLNKLRASTTYPRVRGPFDKNRAVQLPVGARCTRQRPFSR